MLSVDGTLLIIIWTVSLGFMADKIFKSALSGLNAHFLKNIMMYWL